MRVQRKLRPNQARTLSWAAQKKARDMGRGQCVTVLITRGILRVIGADGALIKRGRQSGGLVAPGRLLAMRRAWTILRLS